MNLQKECLDFLIAEAKRYKEFPKEYPEYIKTFGAEWERRAKIYEYAAMAVAKESVL